MTGLPDKYIIKRRKAKDDQPNLARMDNSR